MRSIRSTWRSPTCRGASWASAWTRSISSRPRTTASRPRAATTCSRSTWRWTLYRATRWPTGSRGMATSTSCPTSPPCVSSPGWTRRPWCCAMSHGMTASRCARRRATTYDEPFIQAVRRGMKAAGIQVESSKGEAWPGQQEINFRFADALTMADNHVIYKNGIKEMAQQHGCSVTFMAKPDHRWIGSSCHVHSSLWKGGRSVFDGESETFRQYLAGHIAYASELAIFLAPTINSYKRYAAGSWAPTTLAWGHDNRTCGFRIVGHGQHLRAESRIPGADANPYLAFAALLAAGLHGIEAKLQLSPEFKGNAYESEVKRFPHAMRDAIGELERGKMARQAFGDDVVDHYLHYAQTEQAMFDKVVTDYERARLFERG